MNLIKKLIAIAIALTLMLSLVGCGEKSKEIPNVFGVDFNDAIEILEADGFEVQAVETDAKSILNNLYSEYDGSPQYYGDRPESFEKGAVFKINNYTQDGVGQIYDNDDMYDENMIDEDGKIVIYYAKEAYSGSDGAKDNNEDVNKQLQKRRQQNLNLALTGESFWLNTKSGLMIILKLLKNITTIQAICLF